MTVLKNTVFAATAALQKRAGEGVLQGSNPAHFNAANPITLFIIQASFIIIFTRILGFFLQKIRQPRVIAEVVGGIILGPTVMGRIPHFTENIFPSPSLPYLNLVSTIGLVLFLFLVGLEVDLRVVKKNAKASALISSIGMVLPFGAGAAVGVGLYREFINEDEVSFGHFLLFIGVAMSITAFPVLCRILTELKLLETPVGVVVLSAGVGNDVVGWILLALTVALVNAGQGITALYILLVAVGWTLVLIFAVRPAFIWLARRSGSLDGQGPTQGVMTIAILLVFVSAFVTDIIGVHPIFGGFLVGVIMPHEGGFAIIMAEKIEDIVSILFLPIYFALSGLRTNLGLLDDGIVWAYTILVIAVAFASKFGGCALTANACRFNWRESLAIGTLMSCKGLVELIVLNIGLQAGILDDRVFALMVLMALATTFLTTPLTLWAYPPQHRKPLSLSNKVAEKDAESGSTSPDNGARGRARTNKFLLVLQKMDHVPALMHFVELLRSSSSSSDAGAEIALAKDKKEKRRSSLSARPSRRQTVTVDALRLIELTERTSVVMKSSEGIIARVDPILNIFTTFGRLNRIPVSPALSIVNQDSFSDTVVERADEVGAELVVVPWSTAAASANAAALEDATGAPGASSNPFDSIFAGSGSSPRYSHFLRRVLADSQASVAIFIDRGFGSGDVNWEGQHIFLPFFGGPDDRAALALCIQFCARPGVSATIVRVQRGEEETPESQLSKVRTDLSSDAPTRASDCSAAAAMQSLGAAHYQLTTASASAFPDTIYGQQSTQQRLASDTADNLAWEHFSSRSSSFASLDVTFADLRTPRPLADALKRATEISTPATRPVLVVVGRGRKLASESHREEIASLLAAVPQNAVGTEVRKTIGDPATAFLIGSNKSLLVVQAGPRAPDVTLE